MKSLINKISFVLLANIIGFFVSTIVVLIVPKFINVSQYAFYQLYIFYVGYIGFINFGWPEGILLRYGGLKFEKLDKEGLKTEIILFSTLTTIIGLVIIIVSLLNYDMSSSFVWICVGLCIIVNLPRNFMQVLLHMTNHINEYSISIIIEKVTFLFMVIILLILRIKEYPIYIMAEVLGRFLALLYISFKCKDILKSKGKKIKEQMPEIVINIKVGIKLMIANLAGLFIIGIVRQSIKMKWDIEIFGKVSLTLSISNMLIVFIRAVAIVFFPFLKRMNQEVLPKLYKYLRIGLVTPLFGLLILYYPIKEILCLWLPQYSESLYFMALLFPICIYECKTSLLIETYMKTLRMESKLLIVNIITVILSVVLSAFTVFVLNNLELAVLSILILVSFRCVISEILLAHKIKINITKDIVMELALVWLFVLFNWKIQGIIGLIAYIIVFIVYLVLNGKDIIYVLRNMKILFMNKKSDIYEQN